MVQPCTLPSRWGHWAKQGAGQGMGRRVRQPLRRQAPGSVVVRALNAYTCNQHYLYLRAFSQTHLYPRLLRLACPVLC